jgi:hydrogenase maturation protein HypF
MAMKTAPETQMPPPAYPGRVRARILVHGAVQGVGFRPFVFRVARELGLAGWVGNSREGATIEAEGERRALDRLLERVESEKPPFAEISAMEVSFGPCAGYDSFDIRKSDCHGPATATILGDLATCRECLAEITDPRNRRYRYPFTNCTQCGPRFSIIECLPYDRANTSMRAFPMCPACAGEYGDPASRRFHAQPNACPKCGPQAQLWDASGRRLARGDSAVRKAGLLLREGAIVAMKGIGGFQILADARNEKAVRELRLRKRRLEKPFAVMFPSLGAVREACEVSEGEETLLSSAAAPIVLLRKGAGCAGIAESVAPGNPQLGAMLPYSPLHHLLMADMGIPVVATSGNLSEEPICADEADAVSRLQGIADFFLVHNRPIVRPIDDSVERELLGRPQVLRRARGHAPLPIRVAQGGPTVLALGADLKNTVALGIGRDIFVSQHVGDLESPRARWAFRCAASDLPRLYGAEPAAIACDLHPGYASSLHALGIQAEAHRVQHHFAHVLACMAEHGMEGAVLGVCWDGTGYGSDGTIWGGEFLWVGPSGMRRLGRFRPFLLAGADAAAREPRRSAIAVLQATFGDAAFSRSDLAPLRTFDPSELPVLRQAMARRVNAMLTSSAGRLFDAVASLLGLRHRSTFEGQAAMDLQFSIEEGTRRTYPFEITDGEVAEFDWRPMVRAIVSDLAAGVGAGAIALRFHETLVEVILAFAHRSGIGDVVLTGGCFQNRWLAENAARRLHEAGFRPRWPQRIPPNDGGIALGQVIAARRNRPGASETSMDAAA